MEQKNFIGAGIVPYAECNGKVFYLLGKEARKRTVDRHTWAGFGGKSDRDDSLEATAVREFHQETIGCVMKRSELTCLFYSSTSELSYLDTEVASGVFYRNYFIQVPFDKYPELFDRMREFVEHLPYKMADYLEKERLQWFSSRQLYNACVSDRWNCQRDGTPPKMRAHFKESMKQLHEKIGDLRNIASQDFRFCLLSNSKDGQKQQEKN